MEYSTISILGYFGDTLVNVGLPEACLEWDLNNVTQIENNYVKRESNRIKKPDSNPVKNRESNPVKNLGSN